MKKVLIVNGTVDDKGGTTEFGLNYLIDEFRKYDIEPELFSLKEKAADCTNLVSLIKDSAAELVEKMKDADGLVFGAEERNGSMNAECKMLMDEFFDTCPLEYLKFKGASPFLTLRRDGGTVTHAQMAMYFYTRHMYLVPASYIRIMHGTTVEFAKRDVEALESLESLALTFDWYFKMRDMGKEDGIEEPVHDEPVYSDYIRPETEYEY